MASVKQKQRKDGSIFFEISVSRGHGLSPYTMRWDRPEGLAGKTVKARLQAVASEFERDCRDGKVKYCCAMRGRLLLAFYFTG